MQDAAGDDAESWQGGPAWAAWATAVTQAASAALGLTCSARQLALYCQQAEQQVQQSCNAEALVQREAEGGQGLVAQQAQHAQQDAEQQPCSLLDYQAAAVASGGSLVGISSQSEAGQACQIAPQLQLWLVDTGTD